MANRGDVLDLVRQRVRASWRVGVATVLVAGAIVAAAGLAARLGGIGVRELSQDPAWVARLPVYTGWLGFAGVLCWWTGGVAAVFAAAAMRPGAPWRRFLAWTGALTLWLAADDLFQLHEIVLPVYLHVHEHIVFALYGLATVVYGAAFRRRLAETEFPLLAAACACLAFSVGFDVAVHQMPLQHLIEDGSKLVGVALWTVYLTRVSLRLARGRGGAAAEPARARAPVGRGALAGLAKA